MPKEKGNYTKVPEVQFSRKNDGTLLLRLNDQVVAAVRDTKYEEFTRLTLNMVSENGRMAIDDLKLVGYYTNFEEKKYSPRPVILPVPQEMILTNNDLLIVEGTQIVVKDKEKITAYCLEEFITDIEGYYGVRMKAVVEGEQDRNLPVIKIGEFEKTPAKLGKEGYTVNVNAKGAAIQGATETGTFYGLATLFQLFKRENDRVYIRGVEISDWPDLEWRGAQITLLRKSHLRNHVEMLKAQIKMMARLKGNILIIGSQRLPLPSFPQFAGYDCQWSLEEFKNIVKYAEAHHIKVWPKVCGLSHSGWVVGQYVAKKHPKFWEWIKKNNILGDPDSQQRTRDAINPGSPEAVKLIFKLNDDVIKLTGAKTVFTGMDEIFPPLSEMVPDREPAEVLAEFINKQHAHLKKQGVRMAMYADHLLDSNKFTASSASSGSTHYKDTTHSALEMIPKDIILGDWYYGPKSERGSYKFLENKDFDVFGMPGSCYGNLYESVFYSALEAKRAGIKGIIAFGWSTAYHLNPQVSYILPFIYSWNVPEKMTPDWCMQEVWQYFYQGVKPSLLTEAEPLDITKSMNETLTDDIPDDGKGWFDYGNMADCVNLPIGKLMKNNLIFEIVDENTNSGKSAIIVAAEKTNAKAPGIVTDIPINSKAKSLIFLHIATDGPHSQPIGKYTVHYTDGTTGQIKIVYGQNIGPWLLEKKHTSGFYGSFYKHGFLSESVLGWLGNTKGGDRIALQAYEWVNPFPQKEIKSIDLEVFSKANRYTKSTKPKIALLALSVVK